MDIINQLSQDNFITVNRSIAGIVGLEAAVILGELASEYKYWKDRDGLDSEGFFFSTVENLEARTFLSAHSQRQALTKMQQCGWVTIEKRGMPARRYIRINGDEITRCLHDKSLKILTTSDANFEQQDVENFNDIKRNNDNKTIEKEIMEEKKPAVKAQQEILDQVKEIREDEKLREAFDEFIKMRKLIKAPLTDRALKMIINETYKLGKGNPDHMRQILNQSIVNNWKGVYKLKEDKNDNPFMAMLIQEGGNPEDIKDEEGPMDREKTLRLLGIIKACYPHAKIEDPEGTVAAWLLAFQEDEAREIYKAARFHIHNNKFFPTPGDITECRAKARIIYTPEEAEMQHPDRLTAGEPDASEIINDLFDFPE